MVVSLPIILSALALACWLLYLYAYVPYTEQAAKRPSDLEPGAYLDIWSTPGIHFGWECHYWRVMGGPSMRYRHVVWRPTKAWAENAALRAVKRDMVRWGL